MIGTSNSTLSRCLSEARYQAKSRQVDWAVGIVDTRSGRFWFSSPWDDPESAAMEYRIRVTPQGVAEEHIAVPGGVIYLSGSYPPDGRMAENYEFVPPVERRRTETGGRRGDENDARVAKAMREVALWGRINEIYSLVAQVEGEPGGAIREALRRARDFDPDPAEFGELWPDALRVAGETCQILESMLGRREALEDRRADRGKTVGDDHRHELNAAGYKIDGR